MLQKDIEDNMRHSLQCKDVPPEPCLCWDKQEVSRQQSAKCDVQLFGEEVQWRVFQSAFFLTKAEPKRLESSGEEGSCRTPSQVPACWADSSQLLSYCCMSDSLFNRFNPSFKTWFR